MRRYFLQVPAIRLSESLVDRPPVRAQRQHRREEVTPASQQISHAPVPPSRPGAQRNESVRGSQYCRRYSTPKSSTTSSDRDVLTISMRVIRQKAVRSEILCIPSEVTGRNAPGDSREYPNSTRAGDGKPARRAIESPRKRVMLEDQQARRVAARGSNRARWKKRSKRPLDAVIQVKSVLRTAELLRLA